MPDLEAKLSRYRDFWNLKPSRRPSGRPLPQNGRRIFRHGPLSPEDFELVAKYLCPTGLMVQAVVGSAREACELSQAASRVFGA